MLSENELIDEIKSLEAQLSKKKAELKELVQAKKSLTSPKSTTIPSELGKKLGEETRSLMESDKKRTRNGIDEVVKTYKELLFKCKTKEDLFGFGKAIMYMFSGKETGPQMRRALTNFIDDRHQKWKRDLDIDGVR